ncbi:type II toxin-antitoxin system RelE/ParE family toxin [Bavariicoccus seileri]|uniref:type II toxin-antitoxin system RelE/ParE family toxin n=1 Tax=Bavariicoccus seileri TaxID=549685 RepID=UPI0003B2E899|nr:type II toxin-antitoxin system RelE/ParE family toxin [Bavariicoccus seileri]
MNITYSNRKVEKMCTSLIEAKKRFPEKVAKKLLKLINVIEASDSLESLNNLRIFRFHDLKGERNGEFAFDIDGKKCSYRLIVSFENISKDTVFQNSASIDAIEIREVSNHYE